MNSLFTELRRRNVFKIAAAYVIVAWLVMQVADVVLPTFEAPDWVMQVLVFFLIVGFPVALALAWAFELTPEGFRSQAEADASPGASVRTGQKLNYLVIGGLALALGLVVLDAYVLNDSRPAQSVSPSADAPRQRLEHSVAVLPFENLSPDPNNAYFAEGVHETILNELAKIDDMNVIARTTMLRFRDTSRSIAEIAEELNVETVMEGSVQYANDTVRITAQLIDPETGAHLWSQNYDRNFDDIFAIQTDIATQIAMALEAELTPAERRSIESPLSSSPEAYAFYLRALTHVLDIEPGNTPDQTAQMIAYLDEAIALDPEFAEALALKSFIYAMSVIETRRLDDPLTVVDRIRLADELARQALSIDPSVGLAHTTLGYRYATESDYAAALPSLERAYALNPRDPDVLQEVALAHGMLGNADRARQLIDELRVVNPDDLFFEGYVELKLGNIDAAIAAYEAALRLNQLDIATMVLLGVVEAGQGEAASAIARLRLVEQLAPDLSPSYLTYVAYGYGLAGAEADAQRLFDEIMTASEKYRIGPGNLAMAHLAIGEEAEALRWFDTAARNSTADEGLMSTWSLWLNEFEDERLEKPEFREIRGRFRIRE
jgi:TolB-like protein/Flp pilus assembly protein TadD